MMVKDSIKSVSILAVAMFVFAAASVSSPAQTVKSQIQRMTGWQNCTTCAGANGAGPTSTIYSASGVASPSLSGNSRVFSISSPNAWADGLWWKQLGADNTKTHFIYDVYFYLTAPQHAQALEFDSNQGDGHRHWIYGTQCSIGHGHWDVWGNAAGNWMSTGIPCIMPSAFKWHHLTWEFKRTSTTLTFVSMTYDGVKHYVNKTYTARTSSVKEIDVAFQMDMKADHVAYKAWLDNVKLTYW
jgi:hypothetical protein